ncbi:MAG TPA: 3-deoxy-D-manno-octulosonic acid transferase [Stellaceae bacterium]|jgi:3-deoxy-D-manno-octulosonic-acid transferase|nr:3-deoxy-D-manno-octulosonic acid transferase [Stellaceae bacterium]
MSALRVYRAATTLAGPLVRLYLLGRLSRGKEDGARLGERFGTPSRERPRGPLVWVHAASIGEAVSMLALIDALLAERPALTVLVTTGTVSSARLLASRLPAERAFHQFVPVDRPAYVRRFLEQWQPDLALWVESELWPNLITETVARDIPLLLINGRMSQQSFERWRRWPRLVGAVIGAFDLCLAQDVVQAERLRQLGARRALCVGNLKSAAGPLPVSETELAKLAAQAAGRPLWLAASTHDGEEEAAAEAHRRLRQRWPDLLTLVVPRHPARAGAVAQLLRGRGLVVARRSLAAPITEATDIYLGDTLGELGLFYRLAAIAFIGGSLVPKGGHNPLEAALLDCAILHGPDMSNCAAIARDLATAGASLAIRDAEELAAAVATLLADPAERARRAAAGLDVAADNRAVLRAVLDRIAPWLDRLTPHARSAYA